MARAKTKKKTGRATRPRRGKGESMTGAKAAKVEVRTIGIGDNSGLPLIEPDDFSHHKKTIRGWKEKVSTAQRGYQGAVKAAKSAGVNMESLNLVVKIERDNDPVKAMQFFQQVDLGLSISEESTLRITTHDTLAGDEAGLVARRGFEDGKAGRPPDNKYPDGSDLAKLYSENWQKGQAELMGVDLEEQKDAA